MDRAFAAVLSGVLAVVVAGVASCGPGVMTPTSVPTVRAQPKLVVLLVIDQLPVYAFERDRGLFRGGFARLLRDGAYAAGELPHANTFTAPGHATIGTGAPPSVNGIVGNNWYRRAEHRDRAAEYDADAPMFSAVRPGEQIKDTASSHALRVDGIADVLRRESQGRAHSVTVALKPRAATLVAGRKPDLAVWFEAEAGGMTTSTAYAPQMPAWLAELQRANPPQRFLGTQWTPLDAALLAKHTGIPDDGPGEGDVHGLGTTFPHPISELEALTNTPFGDDLVLDAARAAITAMHLGEDDVPDLLAISLNAHDYAGHTWGPDSWESLDLTLRIDRALGALFEDLDRRFGKDGWAVVMTSDHGATPVVERSKVAGSRRIPPMEIAAALERSLAATLGPGPWVATVTSNQVYMTDRFESLAPDVRTRMLEAMAVPARAVAGIDGAYLTAPMVGARCDQREDIERAICHAVVPDAAGVLFLVPTRGFLITEYKTGTHHDGPNADNRQVPMIVMGAGVAAQTGTPGSQLQIAPTVAALLGISAPPAATAKPLFGLRARSPARP
ncbi:MAG: type phosphodiesterase/nucleotide pyrophosphatase [Myxococcales bacterium]|nr:type phosphodiesterase/nucleotide pyrophosphatase [Myxococcales bacterium]